MTNLEIIESFKRTIDQFYQQRSPKSIDDAQLHFIGGVLQTALHMIPTDDYYDLKKYIYAKWGYNPGGVDGQMNITEWLSSYDPKCRQIDFDTFRPYCKHQMGSIVFNGDEDPSMGCTFKDKKSATCWADWQKCNEQNCPFMEEIK